MAEAPVVEAAETAAAVGGKRSAWMTHVKKTMKAHKGMKLAQVLKMAKKTYKKTKKGGAAALSPALVGEAAPAAKGGRRRGSRKTRGRTRKH